ncbi:MAG: transposase [Bacteroidia bacterium]
MSPYNPAIHHRRSIRLKGYDYGQAGLYFITICCYNRQHIFGNVLNGKMILNEYGKIAHDAWLKTPEIRPNIELGEFIIMPNHIHGIIKITHKLESDASKGESNSPDTHPPNTPSNTTSNPTPQLQSPSNNIGAIVRGYKSSVTKQLNLMHIGYAVWHRNYYENIIRDEQSYQNISNYIINNPTKWQEDKFYTK